MNEISHAVALVFICSALILTGCYIVTFICSKAFFQAKLEYQTAFFKALNHESKGGQ